MHPSSPRKIFVKVLAGSGIRNPIPNVRTSAMRILWHGKAPWPRSPWRLLRQSFDRGPARRRGGFKLVRRRLRQSLSRLLGRIFERCGRAPFRRAGSPHISPLGTFSGRHWMVTLVVASRRCRDLLVTASRRFRVLNFQNAARQSVLDMGYPESPDPQRREPGHMLGHRHRAETLRHTRGRDGYSSTSRCSTTRPGLHYPTVKR